MGFFIVEGFGASYEFFSYVGYDWRFQNDSGIGFNIYIFVRCNVLNSQKCQFVRLGGPASREQDKNVKKESRTRGWCLENLDKSKKEEHVCISFPVREMPLACPYVHPEVVSCGLSVTILAWQCVACVCGGCSA